MKHKCAAVCAAAMLLLTSCGYDKNTDISKWNPEYFSYCFGEDATCKRVTKRERDDKEDNQEYYEITFTDKTGGTHSQTFQATPYKEAWAFGDDAFTEEEYYNYEMERVAEETVTLIAADSFAQQVMKKYFDGFVTEEEGDNLFGATKFNRWHTENNEVEFQIVPACQITYLGTAQREEAALCKKLSAAHIDPQTGWQASTADWKTLAEDPQWEWRVGIILSEDANPDDYLPKFQAAYEEFRACTDLPQNCEFRAEKFSYDTFDTITLWEADLLFGEEIDIEKEKEKNPDFNFYGGMHDRILAYYGG